MGEVNNNGEKRTKSKGIVRRRNRVSTRVDMTPIVDLAFLLLTFFILTTTFIKPQIMELKLPENRDNQVQPKVNEKRVLSIILGGDNRIYWYMGLTDPKVRETDYSNNGIRRVLQEQNKLIDKMFVLIKPDNKSTYENLVDILDEVKITNIQRYSLVDMDFEDHAIMNKHLSRVMVPSESGLHNNGPYPTTGETAGGNG